MAIRWLLLLVAVLGCARERVSAPPAREPLAPWRHLVDELSSEDLGLRPSATVGQIARYVMAELPARQLSARVVSRDGSDTEIVIDCAPELAGRPIAIRAAYVLAVPNRALSNAMLASPKARCPENGTPASIRLKDARVPEMDGRAIALIGTAEPAPRVETRWLPIPSAAVLEVTFGMANPGRAPAFPGARFQLRAEGRDGTSVTLLQRDVAGGEATDQQWHAERIALGHEVERLGREARLVFETSVADGDRPAFPVWGDPVILVPAPPPQPQRRNVVLISLDTMRADRLGCYGAIGGNTPALDRIASEGTLFQTAIAAAPWTLPSHATLLTGFNGCVRLGLAGSDRPPAGISPLAELLRNAGYTTAAFTEGGYMSPAVFQRGFGLYSALEDTAAERPWGNVDRTVGHATDWLTLEAREPFFLFVHTYQVHTPYSAPPPYGDIQRPDDGELASRTLEARGRIEMARYDEEVRYTDAVMARLFETLDGLGLSRRTILVIVADHGDAFGEHGHFQHVLYVDEEVMRVPFIWFAPGLIAAGRRIPTVAGLIDVTPTVLDLLGLPAPQFIQGLSLASFLRDLDPPIGRGTHRFVFAERMLKGTPYPVLARGATWRAVFGASGPLDVRTIGPDGQESKAPAGPAAVDLATKARALYENDCRRLPSLMPREPPRLRPELPDPDQEERLRALGYVE